MRPSDIVASNDRTQQHVLLLQNMDSSSAVEKAERGFPTVVCEMSVFGIARFTISAFDVFRLFFIYTYVYLFVVHD